MWDDLILANHQHFKSLSTYTMTPNAIDGDKAVGVQHGLPAEPEPGPTNPLGFR